MQNVTKCKRDSPAFVSRPHFHLADPIYKQQFQYGIQPEEGLHDSSFWVEPKSSIPVKVEMRLQLNIMLRKIEGIEYLFKNLPEIIFPVFWFDSTAILPRSMAGSLNLLVMLPTIMQVRLSTLLNIRFFTFCVQACGVCSIICSLVIFTLVFFCHYLSIYKRKQKLKPIITQLEVSYTKVPVSERKTDVLLG